MLQYRLKPDGPSRHSSRRLGLTWERGRKYSTAQPSVVAYVKADPRFLWVEISSEPVVEVVEEAVSPPDLPSREEELKSLSVDELREAAEAASVDLPTGYVKKADLIELILAAEG